MFCLELLRPQLSGLESQNWSEAGKRKASMSKKVVIMKSAFHILITEGEVFFFNKCVHPVLL